MEMGEVTGCTPFAKHADPLAPTNGRTDPDRGEDRIQMAIIQDEASIILNSEISFGAIDLHDHTVNAADDLLTSFIAGQVNAVVVTESLTHGVSVPMAQMNGLAVTLHALREQAVSGQREAELPGVHNRIGNVP
jgi:hypothetical protein